MYHLMGLVVTSAKLLDKARMIRFDVATKGDGGGDDGGGGDGGVVVKMMVEVVGVKI